MAKRKKVKVATREEAAAIPFGPIAEVAEVPKEERLRNSHEMIESLRPHLVIAVELLALSKEELVGKTRENLDAIFGFYEELTEALEVAKVVKDLLESAQLRLLVAMSTVEQEGLAA